jgi:hypothetical protein
VSARNAVKVVIGFLGGVAAAVIGGLYAWQGDWPEDSSAAVGPVVLCLIGTLMTAAVFATVAVVGIRRRATAS